MQHRFNLVVGRVSRRNKPCADRLGRLSQELVARGASGGFQTAALVIGPCRDVRSADLFEHAGVRGLALVGDVKTKIDAPRAHEVRSLLIILETPKGRVTVVCVGEKTTFDARRPEFETVARATTLPR